MYLALWGMLFAAPVLSLYVRSMNDSMHAFDWKEVFIVWRQYGIFLVIFLVHNFLLAPLLVYRQRRLIYAAIMACVLALFVTYQCTHRPQHLKHRGPHPMERLDRHTPPDMRPGGEMPDGAKPDREWHHPKDHRPPVLIGEHDIIATIILILMIGMNLGIKLYFKTRDDQKRLVELEKENLAQQLEYLKYQINPHFFMNTLNNIHALIDIDAEKAKTTIIELSRMMRFILYEGDKSGVPLSREFEFIRNYITLMRLRFTDKVRISMNLPTVTPDATIPPLMLISFIENAFKHGISYQHDSFVDIKIRLEASTLHFECLNSKANKALIPSSLNGSSQALEQKQGGVGLANVKQRLKLLYDNNFTLDIDDNTDTYHVVLVIPLG